MILAAHQPQFAPWLGFFENPWVGFEHFDFFFNSIYFTRLLRNTILISLLDLLFIFPAPILLALMLNRKLRGRTIYRALIILPWAIPVFISLQIWRTEYNFQFGAVNQILVLFGLPPQQWLSDPYMNFLALIITNVWLGVPFMMVALATYTKIDPSRLAVFSPTVMRLLRSTTGFSGVILSDDLGDAVAVASIPKGQRAISFLDAGGDEDTYERSGRDDAVWHTRQHSFFLDLPGDPSAALRRGVLRKLVTDPPE